MRNKLNKQERKQENFEKRLTQEREHFYKTCMARNVEALARKEFEKKTNDLETKMRRRKLNLAIKEAKEHPSLQDFFLSLEKNQQKLNQKAVSKKQNETRRKEANGIIDVQQILTEEFIDQLRGLNNTNCKKGNSVLEMVNQLPDFDDLDEERQQYFQKVKEEKKKSQQIALHLLDNKNNLNDVSNSQFAMYVKDQEILEEVATRLFNMHKEYSNYYSRLNPCSVPIQCNLNEIKQNMSEITKSVFTKFRNLEITPQQMKEEVKLNNNKYLVKGADDMRHKIQPQFMRAEQHQGLLSRLMRQKAQAVSQEKTEIDNPNLDIFTNVDALRKFETIPLDSRCLRSLLSKRNSNQLKKSNLIIAQKLADSEKIQHLEKEVFLEMLLSNQQPESQESQTKRENASSDKKNFSSSVRLQEKQISATRKLDEKKKRMEALARDMQRRMTEDRLLVQDMRFLQRLQDDGLLNIVWQPKAKELIDLEDNRKNLQEMNRAEAFKIKMQKKKPRPRSLIYGYTTVTSKGLKCLKEESALVLENLSSQEYEMPACDDLNHNETKVYLQQSSRNAQFDPMAKIHDFSQQEKGRKFEQTGPKESATGDYEFDRYVLESVANDRMSPNAMQEGTILSHKSTINQDQDIKSKRIVALSNSPAVQLISALKDNTDGEISDFERQEVLQQVQNSYLSSKAQLHGASENKKKVKSKDGLGKDISEDIDGSTQQSGMFNPLSRAQQKEFKSNSEFYKYLENDEIKFHHSQIHQRSPIARTSSGFFEIEDKVFLQKQQKKNAQTRSIEKFITHKETKNKIEMGEFYAHRLKTNRFMSKVKADAIARKKGRRNEVTTLSEKELNANFEFRLSAINVNSQRQIYVTSTRNTKTIGSIERESFSIPLSNFNQPAHTLRETNQAVKNLVPQSFYHNKRVSDLNGRCSTSSEPSQNQNSNVKIEIQDDYNPEQQQSAFTLKMSLPIAASTASQNDSTVIDFLNQSNIKGFQNKLQTLDQNPVLIALSNQTFNTISCKAAIMGREQSKASQRMIGANTGQKLNQNQFPARNTVIQTARCKLMTNKSLQDNLRSKIQEKKARTRPFTSKLIMKDNQIKIGANFGDQAEPTVITHRMIQFLANNQLPIFFDNKKTKIAQNIVKIDPNNKFLKDQTSQTILEHPKEKVVLV